MASRSWRRLPAAFRFTYPTNPERHEEAARLLTDGRHGDGIDALPNAIAELCRDVGTPGGLAAYGYGEDDVDADRRGSARDSSDCWRSARGRRPRDDLASIVRESMEP